MIGKMNGVLSSVIKVCCFKNDCCDSVCVIGIVRKIDKSVDRRVWKIVNWIVVIFVVFNLVLWFVCSVIIVSVLIIIVSISVIIVMLG